MANVETNPRLPSGPNGSYRKRRSFCVDCKSWQCSHHRLSEHEITLLEALADGPSNKIVAYRLGLTCGTIKSYLSRIFPKLGVKNRTQAIFWAHEHLVAK